MALALADPPATFWPILLLGGVEEFLDGVGTFLWAWHSGAQPQHRTLHSDARFVALLILVGPADWRQSTRLQLRLPIVVKRGLVKLVLGPDSRPLVEISDSSRRQEPTFPAVFLIGENLLDLPEPLLEVNEKDHFDDLNQSEGEEPGGLHDQGTALLIQALHTLCRVEHKAHQDREQSRR